MNYTADARASSSDFLILNIGPCRFVGSELSDYTRRMSFDDLDLTISPLERSRRRAAAERNV